MENTVLTAMKTRRSFRKVTNTPEIAREKVEEAIQAAITAPTAFNMQSGRLAVLMGEEHRKFWDIVKNDLRARVDEEKFKSTEIRLNGFQSGTGTVLFFEDQTTISKLQEKMPAFRENFSTWSEHGTGMLQYAVWLALSSIGVSASLQHYNPQIDTEVQHTWNLPEEWVLTAQMPFGQADEIPAERQSLPYQDIVKWFE